MESVFFYEQDHLVDPNKAKQLLKTDCITKIVVMQDDFELREIIGDDIQYLPEVIISEQINSFRAFIGLRNLSEISKITNHSSSKKLDLHYMFRGCESLIRVPNFYTGNVISTRGMFANCRKLKDIPNFNTSLVKDFRIMFEHCVSLRYAPVMEISNDAETYGMFLGCTMLEKSNLAEQDPREYMIYLKSAEHNAHRSREKKSQDTIDRIFSRMYQADDEYENIGKDSIPDEILPKSDNNINERLQKIENKIDRLTILVEKLLSNDKD